MRVRLLVSIVVVAAVCIGGVSDMYATFHLMQVEQVTGGVDGDTSAQAIQLRMRSAFQDQVSQARLIVRDAAGANPIIVMDMTNNVANSSAGDRVLIVSTNFVSYTSPAVSPDFLMTQTIPASYLAAGRLTFESDTGVILWSLSWGGTNYTGSNTGSIANDADGNFGPAFSGPLPASTTSALLFTNTAGAASRSNVVDYVVTPGAAAFTNNVRQGFGVVHAPQVTAITQEGNHLRITWLAAGGRSYFVQTNAPPAGGDFTNNFSDLSAVAVPGNGQIATNYLDVGGATNRPARYYRIHLVP